mmetsp:Transcript_48349/g.75506  ORF Transcript_48349/g.75506 Transcript_48349/m.75506 type:complete len:161 (-) Transcript_48349:144-626(-)
MADSNGLRFFSGSFDETVKIWEVEDAEAAKTGMNSKYKCTHTLKGHTQGVTAIFHDSGGVRLFTASSDCTVRIWSLEDYSCISVLEGHKDGVTCMAVDWIGQRLFTGSKDKTIRIWTLISLKSSGVLDYHEAPISALHVDQAVLRLFSGDRDGILKCLKI